MLFFAQLYDYKYSNQITAQLAGTEEYTDCISAEEYPPPTYDTKQSDGKAPLLEVLGMWNISSLPLIPGPLWPGLVVRVPSLGQIELYGEITDPRLNCSC